MKDESTEYIFRKMWWKGSLGRQKKTDTNSYRELCFFCCFFWLHWILVAACRIFCCSGQALSCSMRGFSVVVHAGFLFSGSGAWAPGRIGTVVVVCGLSFPHGM